jgi:NTE family protein
VASELGMNVFADWSPILGQITRGSLKGFVSGVEIEQFVQRHVPQKNIEDLPTRFAVVAADLHTGEPIRINGGPVATAVRASAGVPVAMAPLAVMVRGQVRELVDGGLVEPLPVTTARLMGADIVVAVDVGYRPAEAHIWNPLDVSFQSLQIAVSALRQAQMASADWVITPQIDAQDVSRDAISRLVAEGERAASPVMEGLRAALQGH